MLGTKNTVFKSSVSAEDVKGKLVYSDHSFPPGHLEAARHTYILKTKRNVKFHKASVGDILLCIPRIEPIVPHSEKENEEEYLEEAVQWAADETKIQEAFLHQNGALTVKGSKLLDAVNKAKRRAKINQ